MLFLRPRLTIYTLTNIPCFLPSGACVFGGTGSVLLVVGGGDLVVVVGGGVEVVVVGGLVVVVGTVAGVFWEVVAGCIGIGRAAIANSVSKGIPRSKKQLVF